MKVIALMTDFGTKDPYVGMVKAVILSINPNVAIVDLTHEVPKYSIQLAAHMLKISYRYFPRGTIFVVVVDPGVGTSRRPIIIKSKKYYFVGPDNGVLVHAARDDGIEYAYEINPKVAGLPVVSYTFHGRDIFAPTAAYLSLGIEPSSLGRELGITQLATTEELPKKPRVIDSRTIEVEVIHIDDFGNLILSCDVDSISRVLDLSLGNDVLIITKGKEVRATLVRTFAEVCRGCFAIYEGSYRLAEIAQYLGSASKSLNINVGSKLLIRKV